MCLRLILVLCISVCVWGFHKSISKASIMVRYSSEIDSNKDCGMCKFAPKCSGEYRSKGCDGEGKIQGGIATIPLLSWWPIKVFRPCPSYLAAGYVYRREGQTMDQVLFSEPSNKMKAKLAAMRQIEAEDAAMKKELQDPSKKLSNEEENFLNQRFNKDK